MATAAYNRMGSRTEREESVSESIAVAVGKRTAGERREEWSVVFEIQMIIMPVQLHI